MEAMEASTSTDIGSLHALRSLEACTNFHESKYTSTHLLGNFHASKSASRRAPQETGESARTHSYQTGFQSTKLSGAPYTEQDYPYPLGVAAALVVQERLLLVFGREGGDSFRNLDRRERWPLPKATTYSTQHPPKFHRDRISFQNHRDGLNTTHNTSPISWVRRQHEQLKYDAACIQPWRTR